MVVDPRAPRSPEADWTKPGAARVSPARAGRSTTVAAVFSVRSLGPGRVRWCRDPSAGR